MTRQETEFYFGGAVHPGIVGLVATYRSNDENNAFRFLYTRLKSLSEERGDKMYFFRVGASLLRPTPLRTKMGLRREVPLAHRQNLVNMEIHGANGYSRLAVLGRLNEDAIFASRNTLLNWTCSLLLISKDDIEFVATKVRSWINVSEGELTGFDFSKIFSEVMSCGILVARFFPSDNDRFPAVSLLLSESFLARPPHEAVAENLT